MRAVQAGHEIHGFNANSFDHKTREECAALCCADPECRSYDWREITSRDGGFNCAIAHVAKDDALIGAAYRSCCIVTAGDAVEGGSVGVRALGWECHGSDAHQSSYAGVDAASMIANPPHTAPLTVAGATQSGGSPAI